MIRGHEKRKFNFCSFLWKKTLNLIYSKDFEIFVHIAHIRCIIIVAEDSTELVIIISKVVTVLGKVLEALLVSLGK